MTVETNEHADLRDATYLAAQLRTNHAVTFHKARMQQALTNLHQVFLDVTEAELRDDDSDTGGVTPEQVRARISTLPEVSIPVPRIDTVSSRPRSATPTYEEALHLTESLRQARSKH